MGANVSIIRLGTFLFLIGAVYLIITILGFSFVSMYGFVLSIIYILIILWLTISGIVNRKKTTKISDIISLFVPLMAIFLIFIKGVSSDTNGINNYFFTLFAYITLICSMIMFYFYVNKRAVKIVLGIVYSILLVPIFFFLFIGVTFGVIFGDFVENTVIKSEISPSSIYLAEIVDNDQGALGGNTYVNVTRQPSEINLIFGKLKRKSKYIYKGRWGEFETMTLRWESDEVLYINDKRFDIP
jgi:hypothetical protein